MWVGTAYSLPDKAVDYIRVCMYVCVRMHESLGCRWAYSEGEDRPLGSRNFIIRHRIFEPEGRLKLTEFDCFIL